MIARLGNLRLMLVPLSACLKRLELTPWLDSCEQHWSHWKRLRLKRAKEQADLHSIMKALVRWKLSFSLDGNDKPAMLEWRQLALMKPWC